MSKHTLKIEQDTDPSNPRTEFENLCTMACFHNRYTLGDEDHGIDHTDYNSWEEMGDTIAKDKSAAVMLPLYLYDHSGITMATTPFGCRWDSGQVGWAWMTKEQIIEAQGRGKYLTRKLKHWAEDVIRAEVEEYDRYLTGDVWGYVIEDEDGNTVDSCWGFFGEEYARSEGQMALEAVS